MEKDQAASLYEIYNRALANLALAEPVLWSIGAEEERKALTHAHTNIIVSLLTDLQAPIVRQYPELDTSESEEEPEDTLSSEEQEAVDRLTTDQVARIDRLLLEGCAPSWRKVARIVGTAMTQVGSEHPGIPDIFYAQRVAILVSNGHIESQGNLAFMRYSEVRLPS